MRPQPVLALLLHCLAPVRVHAGPLRGDGSPGLPMLLDLEEAN